MDELALLLLGTDRVEDPLAVLALGDVELAGRLAVSGENLGLVAAGLTAAGDAAWLALARVLLLLEADGEVGRHLAVLHLVAGRRAVVGQHLQ